MINGLRKFRKKTAIIEAIQFDGKNGMDIFDCLGRFVSAMGTVTGVDVDYDGITTTLKIKTLEGTMTASPGDWIVKGVYDELYPVKPEIFAETYEEIDG